MKRLKRNESGQALAESMMWLLVIMVVSQLVLQKLNDAGAFQKAFGGPWSKLMNVITYGVPVSDVNKAKALHPANIVRHNTVTPK